MARAIGADHTPVFRFRVLDGTPFSQGVFTPKAVYAYFQKITAPEISISVEEIVEGNNNFPHKIYSKASVNTITFEKGIIQGNSDFYNWIANFIKGTTTRKTLVVELLSRYTYLSPLSKVPGIRSSRTVNQSQGILFGTPLGSLLRRPIKQWVLHACVPTRFKASDDLDAESGDIAITELDVDYHHFTERMDLPVAEGAPA